MWSNRITNILQQIAQKKPLTLFLAISMAIGLPAFILPLAFGTDVNPSKLGVTIFVLFGWAVGISALRGGKAEVKRLFSGITKWRFGLVNYFLVLAVLPLLTLLVSAMSGSLQVPDKGWVDMLGRYLLMTVVVGALIINLWEETAWTGFVQERLMQRHGLFIGSFLTALPFIGIHVPLIFELKGISGTSAYEIVINLSALILVGLCFRYLAGKVFLATSKSILAVGLLHASFNASGSLTAVSSQWPSIFALLLLTIVLAIPKVYTAKSGGSQ